jgi:hypothetical protein
MGLAPIDSIPSFTVGSVLMGLGGTVSFLTSFLLGFVVPARRVSVVMTALNCAFDGSTCIFLFFYLIYHHLKISRSALFIFYAVLAAIVYTALFFLWLNVGSPILTKRKTDTSSRPSKTTETAETLLPSTHVKRPDTEFELTSSQEQGKETVNDDEEVVVVVAYQDKDQRNEDYKEFHNLLWFKQLASTRFICIALYGSIHIFRSNAFMGIIKNILYLLGDESTGYLITTLYSIILPLGGIFIPFIDYIIFSNSFISSLHICTCLGIIYGFLILIPILRLQILTFIIFCFFRALFFSVIGTYSVQIFGPINAGRTYGCTWMCGAILNVMVYPSLIITDKFAGGSYVPFNAFLLSLCLPAFLSTQFFLKSELLRVSGCSHPTSSIKHVEL